METTSVSNIYSLNKSTYINLRWIGIIGQFLTINIVYIFFKFQFNIYLTNLIIILGIISNLILVYFYQKNILSNRASFIFLLADILQLGSLIYFNNSKRFFLIQSWFKSKLNTHLFNYFIYNFINILSYWIDLSWHK